MKYRKRPVVIEAHQWFKNGDHPEDNCKSLQLGSVYKPKSGLTEGEIVRYFRDPEMPEGATCFHCGIVLHDHGWIDTLEGGHRVCPGDWIIKGVQGELYPCKPDIFALTYEAVDDQPPCQPEEERLP